MSLSVEGGNRRRRTRRAGSRSSQTGRHGLRHRPSVAAEMEAGSSVAFGDGGRESELARWHRAERSLVRIRAAAVPFALVQVLTYYRRYPAGIETAAIVLVAALALAVATVWLIGRRVASERDARRLSIAGLAIDAAAVMGFVFIYTFDQQTAIWALLFIVPLEAALRFGLRGSTLTMAGLALAYTAREVFGSAAYGNPLLFTSITFRMGIGFIVAAFAGVMASHEGRDRELLQSGIDRHTTMLQALGDMGEGFLIIGEGGIVDANEALSKINGYSREEMIGAKSMFQFLVEDEVERIKQQFARRLNGHGVPDHYETAVRHKDGHRVDIEVVVKTTRIDAQPYVIGIIRDITERKRLTAAVQAAYEEEHEVAEQLRSVDEMKNAFLNAVSHELRTPLTPVIGLSVTLAERGDELAPAEIKFLAQRLAHNATRLERLLSDLLDLDRITRGILEPRRRATSMSVLVNEAVTAVRNGTHEIDLSGVDDLSADIDPAMTERIVENLVANAMKHTPEGSRVWVRVTPADGGIVIAVEDDGPGVAPHLRTAVFEPFRQGPEPRSSSSGAGIGLSLVAQFAKLHGGRAWVEGREGGGAAFRVMLPCTVGASQLTAS